MIVCASLYQENYQSLADKTLKENRQRYCEKNGYEPIWLFSETVEGGSFENACFLGFKKIELILEIFQHIPHADYVWFADCDAMVMNMRIRIEEIVKKYPFDILVGSDKNGMSCGSMILKKCDSTLNYLNNLLVDRNSHLHEQDFFWKNPKPFIFKTPQREMNSWDCTLPSLGPDNPEAQFQTGDFFIHWPSQSIETRLACYEKFKGKVID